MNEDDRLRILATIRIGQDIPGMNKGTVFRFAGLGRYDSHGRAREFDGWPIVTLDSQHRTRPHIRPFVSVLATFLKDGRASLASRLTGPSTRFLPFNRGRDGGAGNPPVEDRHRTCYLWEEVWQRDNLLDLVDGVTAQPVADAGLQQAARVNDKGNFGVPLREALDDALVTRHEKHGDFINKLFQDEALGAFFRDWMLDQVYGRLRGGSDSAVRG